MALADPHLFVAECLAGMLRKHRGLWAIGGSAAAAFYGASVSPADLDVFADGLLVNHLTSAICGTVLSAPHDRRSARFRSRCSEVELRGVRVHIIGGFSELSGRGCPLWWKEPCQYPVRPWHAEGTRQDDTIPFMQLPNVLRLYELLEQFGRADMIGRIMARAAVPNRGLAIGIDVGDVILKHFGRLDLEAVPAYGELVPGAIEAFERRIVGIFPRRYLISKAECAARKTIQSWLAESGAMAALQVGESNLFFTDTMEEKAEIATKLGLTHFIDDRWSALEGMNDVSCKIHLLGHSSRDVTSAAASNVYHAANWAGVERIVSRER